MLIATSVAVLSFALICVTLIVGRYDRSEVTGQLIDRSLEPCFWVMGVSSIYAWMAFLIWSGRNLYDLTGLEAYFK